MIIAFNKKHIAKFPVKMWDHSRMYVINAESDNRILKHVSISRVVCTSFNFI